MTFGLVLLLSVLGFTYPIADSWQCRNDLEVSCANGKCDAKTTGGFTSMGVSFGASGKMSVCAYSGCWEGTGAVTFDSNFLMLTGKNLKFSTSDMRQDIAITLDKKDNIAIIKAGSFAQPLICKKTRQNPSLPKFEDYKVPVSKTKPKPIKFDGNKDAWTFRTRLRRANKNGVNFAGHFIFTTWGCGTSCVQGAIVNTKTGVVYFPEEIGVMTFGMGNPIDENPLKYQSNSKLFILSGNAGNSEKGGTSYFVWQGTKFKLLKFIPFE